MKYRSVVRTCISLLKNCTNLNPPQGLAGYRRMERRQRQVQRHGQRLKSQFCEKIFENHHNLEPDEQSRQRHWSLFLRHELPLPIVPSPFFRWGQFVKQHISKQRYPLSTVIVLKYLLKPFRNTTSMASILTGNTQVFILWETICQNVITFLFRQEGRESRGQRKLHSPD